VGQPRFLHLGLSLLVFLAACGGREDGAGVDLIAEVYGDGGAAGYKEMPGARGTIKGKVFFTGTPERYPPWTMSGDPLCTNSHPKGLANETFVLNADGKTLKWVFVSIKRGIKRGHPVPSKDAVLNQVGCQYQPHVLGLMAGQRLVFKNSDPILHNVHAIPRTRDEINFGQSGVKKDFVEFNSAEPAMLKVFCDVHGWMGAYVGVLSHPFFDVTGDDGSFAIENAPPGKFLLEAWSEAFETPVQQEVELKPGQTLEINLTFKR
jgi:plastocyanin